MLTTETTTVLHLGAHRTGTTSMQAAMDSAFRELLERGIVVLTPPRSGKRDEVTSRKLVNLLTSAKNPLSRLFVTHKSRETKELLTKLLQSKLGANKIPTRLILSDEKMLGRAFDNSGRSIYPRSYDYLASVSRLLPMQINEIHLTIRSYDTFLTSAYAMRAVYGRGVKPFQAIEKELLQTRKRWPQVVDEVKTVFPNANIFVSSFEATGLTERLDVLLGIEPGDLDIAKHLPDRLNRAPTAEAIEFVRNAVSNRDADKIVDRFEGGTEFDPLDQATKDTLRQRYQDDICALKQRNGLAWIEGAFRPAKREGISRQC